jgi:iron only hydrogenase large subunit-like protein
MNFLEVMACCKSCYKNNKEEVQNMNKQEYRQWQRQEAAKQKSINKAFGAKGGKNGNRSKTK